MSYVVHVSQQSQHTTTVQERERTPLGKVVAWWVRQLAGTALQKPMETLLIDSLVGRITAAITVSLLIGAIVDLTVSFSHLSVSTLYAGRAAVAVLAGGAAGGPGGAVVGVLWGWVVGEVVDATTAETVSHFLPPIVIQAISWLIAALSGWISGNVARLCFVRFAKSRPRPARFIGGVAITAALASIAVVVAQLARCLYPSLPEIWRLTLQVVGIGWRPFVALLVWICVLAWPFVISSQVRSYQDFAYFQMARYDHDYWQVSKYRGPIDFHRRHPKLLVTWLVFLTITAVGTVELLRPEFLLGATYVIGGVWVCGIGLALQWLGWGRRAHPALPRWGVALMVLDVRIADGTTLDQYLRLIMDWGGSFEIQDLSGWQHNTEPSACRIGIAGDDSLTLAQIVRQMRELGAAVSIVEMARLHALECIARNLKDSVVSPWLMQTLHPLSVAYVTTLWVCLLFAEGTGDQRIAILWVLLLGVGFEEDLRAAQVLDWLISLGTVVVGLVYLLALSAIVAMTDAYFGHMGVIGVDVMATGGLFVAASIAALTTEYRRLLFVGVLGVALLYVNSYLGHPHVALALGIDLSFKPRASDERGIADVVRWLILADLLGIAVVGFCAIMARWRAVAGSVGVTVLAFRDMTARWPRLRSIFRQTCELLLVMVTAAGLAVTALGGAADSIAVALVAVINRRARSRQRVAALQTLSRGNVGTGSAATKSSADQGTSPEDGHKAAGQPEHRRTAGQQGSFTGDVRQSRRRARRRRR